MTEAKTAARTRSDECMTSFKVQMATKNWGCAMEMDDMRVLMMDEAVWMNGRTDGIDKAMDGCENVEE